MALDKKKSRPITVEKINYRYIVNRAKKGVDGIFELYVTIQSATGVGAKLIFSIKTRDIWLDYPFLIQRRVNLNGPGYVKVTPSDVAKIIRIGIEQGWDPLQNGKPFYLKSEQVELKEG